MLYKWFIASRPWTFTAAIIPVTLGAVLAWSQQFAEVHILFFFLTLIGGIFLQAGANFLNTYGDYTSGVDTIYSAITCPQIVTGILPINKVKQVGVSLLVFAVIIGVFLTILCGWIVFIFGVIGVICAASYTTGIFPYKYKGFGPFVVFLLMGPCMVLPAYYIQSGELRLIALFASLPIAFLVTAIMHANDLRDIEYDQKAGIQTVALWLGLKKSIVVYELLCLGAFVTLIFLIGMQILPYTCVLPLVTFPFLYKKIQKINIIDATADIKNLVKWTARFHFFFGLFFILGVLLSSPIFS